MAVSPLRVSSNDLSKSSDSIKSAKESASSHSINDLTDTILVSIFRRVVKDSLVGIPLVCQRWNHLSNDSELGRYSISPIMGGLYIGEAPQFLSHFFCHLGRNKIINPQRNNFQWLFDKGFLFYTPEKLVIYNFKGPKQVRSFLIPGITSFRLSEDELYLGKQNGEVSSIFLDDLLGESSNKGHLLRTRKLHKGEVLDISFVSENGFVSVSADQLISSSCAMKPLKSLKIDFKGEQVTHFFRLGKYVFGNSHDKSFIFDYEKAKKGFVKTNRKILAAYEGNRALISNPSIKDEVCFADVNGEGVFTYSNWITLPPQDPESRRDFAFKGNRAVCASLFNGTGTLSLFVPEVNRFIPFHKVSILASKTEFRLLLSKSLYWLIDQENQFPQVYVFSFNEHRSSTHIQETLEAAKKTQKFDNS